MKPNNFEKIDGKRFTDSDGIERRMNVGYNIDTRCGLWVDESDGISSNEKNRNVFLFKFDWINDRFDVLTVKHGRGVNGIVHPEHLQLPISRPQYKTPEAFLTFISEWVEDNKFYLDIEV
jgi:hypothetical protein